MAFFYIETFAGPGLVVKNYSKSVQKLEREIVLNWSVCNKGDLTGILKMPLSCQ